LPDVLTVAGRSGAAFDVVTVVEARDGATVRDDPDEVECDEEDLDEDVDDEELLELEDAELEEPVAPAFTEQTGQAPQPCPARTFSATAICVDLEASAGFPDPP
jgi:hypothetical protein